ncbi:MAG: VCBS repeat-containing protein, partial [bacterium]|nr:VCBS repeat-containing protein [bacterium]
GSGFKELNAEHSMAAYDDGYESPSEGSWQVELRTERDGIRVYEWQSVDARPFRKADVRDRLASFLDPIDSLDMGKYKLDRVEEITSPQEAVVRAFLWLRGIRNGGESFETQALFRMWMHEVGTEWKITRQELIRGTTVSGEGRGFADVAPEVGIDFVAARNPRFDNDPEWHLEKFGILKYGSAGVTATDYDDDGWYDLFYADGAVAHFYRNQGDGTFAEVTTEVGFPGDLLGVNIALFADFDNDGDKDVFMGRFTEPNLLYRNDGGTFTDVSAAAGLSRAFVTVATAGDYDNDGDLDLY